MMRLTPKQILILTAIVAVIGIVIYVIISAATHGTIKVTTATSYQLTISRLGNLGTAEPSPSSTSITTKGPGSFRVPTGIYTVAATDGTLSTSKVVSVHAGKTMTISLVLDDLTNPEAVINRHVTAVIADATSLKYLDLTKHALYSVDASNIEHIIDTTHQFTVVKWADPNYGIALDSKNNLYRISNNVITPIKLPFATAGLARVYTALSHGRILYVGDGKSIYYETTPNVFKKLYTNASTTVSIYTANDTNVLIGETNSYNQKRTNIFVLRRDGSKTVSSPRDFYESSWAPDGQHFIVSSDDTTAVYDQNYNLTIALPENNVNTPIWLDNQTVLYGVTGKMWLFNISTGNSKVIADVTDTGYVTDISPSTDGTYIYFVLQNTVMSTYQLERIGLKGQAVSTNAVALPALLPTTVAPCTFDEVNFTVPTVVVRSPAANATTCMAAARGFLAPYANTLDLAHLPFYPSTDL